LPIRRSHRCHPRRRVIAAAGRAALGDRYAALFRAAGVHTEEGTQRYLSLPFFRDGIPIRTRFIDDALDDGLAMRLDQIVLLGAGFDARALRTRARAAHRARVYEVDLADRLDRKRSVLETA
jgi:O-methyltransferase involved in polyketide biosynthesis